MFTAEPHHEQPPATMVLMELMDPISPIAAAPRRERTICASTPGWGESTHGSIDDIPSGAGADVATPLPSRLPGATPLPNGPRVSGRSLLGRTPLSVLEGDSLDGSLMCRTPGVAGSLHALGGIPLLSMCRLGGQFGRAESPSSSWILMDDEFRFGAASNSNLGWTPTTACSSRDSPLWSGGLDDKENRRPPMESLQGAPQAPDPPPRPTALSFHERALRDLPIDVPNGKAQVSDDEPAEPDAEAPLPGRMAQALDERISRTGGRYDFAVYEDLRHDGGKAEENLMPKCGGRHANVLENMKEGVPLDGIMKTAPRKHCSRNDSRRKKLRQGALYRL